MPAKKLYWTQIAINLCPMCNSSSHTSSILITSNWQGPVDVHNSYVALGGVKYTICNYNGIFAAMPALRGYFGGVAATLSSSTR